MFNTAVFFVYQYLLLAGQVPVSGHLSPIPLVAAYENHCHKRPAPVTDIFIVSRGCPLTRASTVPQILFLSTGDLGASAILGSLDSSKYLGKLISYLDPVVPDAFRSEFVRCWHAKTDGSAASTFHNNCDGKGPTVTIIKSGSYIFGGYTDLSWQSKYS